MTYDAHNLASALRFFPCCERWAYARPDLPCLRCWRLW